MELDFNKLIESVYLDYENYYDVQDSEIHFAIAASDKLIEYADFERSCRGLIPFFHDFGKGVDDDGYYDFYLSATATEIIEFYYVPTTNQEDDMKGYDIPLTDEFKKALFDRMNQLCEKKLGRGIRDLICEEA